MSSYPIVPNIMKRGPIYAKSQTHYESYVICCSFNLNKHQIFQEKMIYRGTQAATCLAQLTDVISPRAVVRMPEMTLWPLEV